MRDIYEKLREKIDKHPMGAPNHPAILMILEDLFTVEEAGLAVHMSFKGLIAEEIARRAGVKTTEAMSLLESMSNKGIIYCMKSKNLVRYALMPPMPGFFEFSLVKGADTPETRRQGRLWEEYFTGALGDALHGTKIPMSRVIPVSKKISYGMEIFPYEECVEILKRAKKIALGKCQCRLSAQKCDAPLDVCIMLDGWADFVVDRGLARPIKIEEAIDALERSEEAGLVHTTTNTKKHVPYICNCCSCCCYMLRGVTELGRRDLASSSFVADVDEDICIGCEECINICKFEGIELNDKGVVRVIQENCLGCGICASVCPEDALSMVQRSDPPEPYDLGNELLLDIAKDKNKLNALMNE
jgi:Pyruvate/2-oxoacid:ferredoxin oxidoreductase delta subunit